MKVAIVGAALALLVMGAGSATVPDGAPRLDLSGLPSQTASVIVPLGHAVKATVTADGLTLETIPLASIESHPEGTRAGCVASGGSVTGKSPYLCGSETEFHQTSIRSVSVLFAGRGTQMYADALDHSTWRYFFILCNGPSVSGFAPLPDRASCQASGSTAGFTNWEGLVGILNPASTAAVFFNS